MKRLLTLTCLSLLFFVQGFSQSVWIEPTVAGKTTINDEIKIIFDKQSSSFWTNGPSGVFIHAGVAVNGATSTDWTYGNGAWDDLSTSRQMTQEGNLWTKTITPRDYFNIPDGVTGYRIQLLFRNEYNTAQANNREDNNGNNFFIDLDPAPAGAEMFTVSPALPSATDLVTVTFRAANVTDPQLVGESKVYFHAAAVTSGPTATSWDHSVGNWGADDGVGEMTSIGTDTWQFSFVPQTYFGVTDPNENIFRIAMVFRNADGSAQQKNSDGTDIMHNIDPGFHVLLNEPSSNLTVIPQGGSFQVAATASETANFTVTLGGTTIHNATGTSIDFSETFTTASTQDLTVSATSNGVTKSKTVAINGYSAITRADVPSGMEHGINYDENDPTTATLVLHLPTQNKDVVHVIGDFNNWTVSNAYKMNRNLAGDTWWYTLTGLTPAQEYIFQYVIDGEVRVADPYAQKVSDPWNDQYITDAVYPNLLDYPSDDTWNIASYLQTQEPEYTWEVPNFQRPSPNKLNIYELHFRDFTEEGTYAAAMARLDYLQDLGINCIHMMPVSEFEGNDSWGYNPNFYFAADKAYGTEEELKRFIDEAHKRGMAVINDMVLNHAFNTNAMAQMYWNSADNRPASDNPWFNAFHNFEVPDAHWGSDFNHESGHTEVFIDRVLDYWLTEFNIDGFRFDFTKGFSNNWKEQSGDTWGSLWDQQRVDNLKRMVNEMWAKHPGSYAIFEHLADKAENKELADFGILQWGGHSVTKNYEEIVLGWNNYNLSNAVANATENDFVFDNMISYMESHDEERLAYKLKTYGRDFIKNDLGEQVNRLKQSALFNLLIPGPRMIWQFGEVGYDVSINFNGRTGRKPIHWEYLDVPERKELHDFYALLLNLRNKYEAFHHFTGYTLDGNNWVKRMQFQHGDTVVVVMGNFQAYDANSADNNGHQAYFDIDPQLPWTGNWYEVISGEWHSLGNSYRLHAGDYKIYSNYPLTTTPAPVGGNVSLSGDLDFNDVAVNTSVTQSFTIINNNATSLSVTSIDLPTGFSANWTAGNIAAGASQNVTVTFAPTARITYSGSITVNTDDIAFTNNTLPVYGNSAIVTTNPASFNANDQIQLVFHAQLADGGGTSGLVGASKVYIHTGVVTSGTSGTGWNHVIGNWGADDGVGQMTPVAGETDQWAITITPSSYYGAPANTTIYRLAMVFRNENGSQMGKGVNGSDIYIDVNQGSSRLASPESESKLAESSFKLYPNPTKDGRVNVSFQTETIQRITLKIIDNTGRTLFTKDAQTATGRNVLRLSNLKLTAGVYILQIPELGISKLMIQR